MGVITRVQDVPAADAPRAGVLFLSSGEEEAPRFDDAEHHEAEPEVHQRPEVELKALVPRRRRQVGQGEEIEPVADEDDDQIPNPE